MPNPVGDISKIQLPDGNQYNIKDTVSGYSKVFKINVTSSSNTYSADKTYSEIVSAYESGEYDLILVGEEATNDEYVAPLQTYDSTHDILTFICVCDESRSGAVASGNKNIIRKYQIEDDETVTVSESILPPFMTILSYGHNTWQDFLDAYDNNAIVYCRASSQSNPASGNQTRMAFMAYVNASPPTEVEFQYYRSMSSHTASNQGDQVYIYKLNKTNGWSVTVREAATKIDIASGTSGLVSTFTTGATSKNALKVDLLSYTKLTNSATTKTEVANKIYPVALDNSGHLAVNVPWTDTTDVTDVTVDSTSIVSSGVANLVTSTSHPYDPSTNPLATVDDVSSAGGGTVKDVQVNGTSVLSSGVANLVTNTAYSASSNKIATMSDVPTVTSTYSSTGTNAVNGTAVNAALQTLDSSISATSGQAISAITITDGKIASSSKINVGEANTVTDVQINGTSVLSSKVANLVTNTAYNSSSNKIATMSDVPSAGTSASAVGTTASGGSATTWSKSDHVHNITSSTITSALGFTPVSSSGVTSVTAGAGLNTTSSDTATDGGSITSTGTLYLTKSGVTAGTYGSATKSPAITVDKYGRITGVTNTTISGVTPAAHSHGDINNAGTVTSTAVTPGNGDYILITDSSDSTANKVKRGIAIGTSTTTFLTNDGTWQTVGTTIRRWGS